MSYEYTLKMQLVLVGPVGTEPNLRNLEIHGDLVSLRRANIAARAQELTNVLLDEETYRLQEAIVRTKP